MAKKILSFEEYQVQLKAGQDTVESTEEVVAESCEECGEEPCVCEDEKIEDESDEEQIEIEDEESDEDESEEEIDDDDDDDDDDDEDSDDDEEDDDDDDSDEDDDDDEDDAEEAEEGGEEVEGEPTVSEYLKEAYAKVKEEACAYEQDDYQDHTLEGYLKENAALVATLAAQALEESYSEVKEGELTQEMYEAHCNEMKEAYAKKIEELKEAWNK